MLFISNLLLFFLLLFNLINTDKLNTLEFIARNKSLGFPPENISILAFKKERILEVWFGENSKKHLIKNYNFSGFSGGIGPKLQEGDGQIPEGIYAIKYLNPNSKFHLSFCLDYPNSFDRRKAEEDNRSDLGSAICIHGGHETTGCIPVGDDAIEEIYQTINRTGKENVEIIIFPSKLRANGMFAKCEVCPSWTNELYLILKTKLSEFR